MHYKWKERKKIIDIVCKTTNGKTYGWKNSIEGWKNILLTDLLIMYAHSHYSGFRVL